MHEYLILVPGLISLVVSAAAGPRRGFVYVFLPTLSLLPLYPVLNIQGLPDLRFFHAAIIPVILVWILEGCRGYRLHAVDFLVLAYIAMCVISEGVNVGFKLAYNYAAILILGVLLPYLGARLAARTLLETRQLIKVVVVLGALLGALAVWEARMWQNPLDFWERLGFYSGYAGVMRRYGFKRAVLVFEHPIFLGHYFAQILPLAVWFFWTAGGNVRKYALLCLGGVFGGLLAGISRGPWVGAGFAVGLLGVTRMKQKIIGLAALVVLFVFGVLFVAPEFEQYARYKRTGDQATVTYRRAAWLAYIPQVLERPLVGRGRRGVKLTGYKELGFEKIYSVDNEFLFLGLYHGLIAVGFFVAGPVVVSAGLARTVLNELSIESLLAGALIAAVWGSLVTYTSVFRGTQPYHFFFILLGMATQTLVRQRSRAAAAAAPRAASRAEPRREAP